MQQRWYTCVVADFEAGHRAQAEGKSLSSLLDSLERKEQQKSPELTPKIAAKVNQYHAIKSELCGSGSPERHKRVREIWLWATRIAAIWDPQQLLCKECRNRCNIKTCALIQIEKHHYVIQIYILKQ